MKQIKLFKEKTIDKLEKAINAFCHKLDSENHQVMNIHVDVRNCAAHVIYGT